MACMGWRCSSTHGQALQLPLTAVMRRPHHRPTMQQLSSLQLSRGHSHHEKPSCPPGCVMTCLNSVRAGMRNAAVAWMWHM